MDTARTLKASNNVNVTLSRFLVISAFFRSGASRGIHNTTEPPFMEELSLKVTANKCICRSDTSFERCVLRIWRVFWGTLEGTCSKIFMKPHEKDLKYASYAMKARRML